ncbi:MAG: CPBP family intramembrane metalloprotease [Chloroflexi bacterium]|nr:CPBP family intramembrane metalloprotease [Chloroflexota bacterium]
MDRTIRRWVTAGLPLALIGILPWRVWGDFQAVVAGTAMGLVAGGILYFVLAVLPRSGPRARHSYSTGSWIDQVLLIPIAEELVWRGLAFQVLRSYVPVAVALAVSVIGFSLVHFGNQGAKGLIVHLVTGAAFAGVTVATGTLASAIAAHIAYNYFAVTVIKRERARGGSR